jgi:tetratricopeptide (TPR) repeat protein
MVDDKAIIIKMAFLYVQSGEWYKAIEEYKKLLADNPEDAHVHNMMGDAYAKKQDDADAFQSYQKAKELYERQGLSAKIANVEKKIAKLNFDRIPAELKKAFRTISKSQEAEQKATDGNVDDAITHYQQLIAAEPINFSYREKLSNLYLEHAQISDASAQLKAIADIHLSEGRLDAAQAMADKILNIDPEGLETLRLFFSLAKKKGDREAMAIQGGKLAQKAFESALYEEAKSTAEAATAAGNGGLGLLQAKILLGLKQPKEAKAKFDELLAKNPEDSDLLEQLLTLSEDTKDWNSAYQYLNRLMALRPNDIKLLPRQARVLLQTGKRAEALSIYMQMAQHSLVEGKLDPAQSYLDNILGLEPENVEALKKKAEVCLKQNKKQDVIDIYKKLQVIYTNKKMVEEAKKMGLVLTRLAGMK